MPRYIDADAMIKKLFPYDGVDKASYSINAKAVHEAIKNAPTADVVEVRHGSWKRGWCDNNLIGHEYEECSECGCCMLDTNQFWNSNFCPHCGAKMRGNSE